MTKYPRKHPKRYLWLSVLAVASAATGIVLYSLVNADLGRAAPSTAATFVDYAQCANGSPGTTPKTSCNGGWINGILNPNNSQYSEDQVTAQRSEVNAGGGSTNGRTLTFSYLARKAGSHAYDSLATWNTTETGADRCAGLSATDCVPGIGTSDAPWSTYAIPLDCKEVPTATLGSQPAGCTPDTDNDANQIVAGHQLSGQVMTMYGGIITGVSTPTYDSNQDVPGTDTYAQQTITYCVPTIAPTASVTNGSGCPTSGTTGTTTNVQLLFGGHLAPQFGPRGWGAGLGSANISGGPYHIKFKAADGESIGNRDNQIMSSAILAQPTLSTDDTSFDHSNLATGTPYTNVGDTATLSGFSTGGTGGTDTFTLYLNSTCTTAVSPQPTPNSGTNVVPLTGSGTASFSATWTPTATGIYYWGVVYSGDAANIGTSECGGAAGVTNETISVVKASPPISTNDSSYDHTSMVVGTQYTNVGDSASLGTGFVPGGTGGTVTFTLYSNSICTTAVSSQPVPASGTNTVAINSTTGTASFSGTWTPTAPGTYYWGVSFSGDTFNNTTSQCGGAANVTNETITVIKASPPISTNDSSYDHTSMVVGTPYTNVGDSASLGAGFVPGGTGGTVTFTLYSNSICTTAVSSQPVPASGTNTVAINSTTGTASFSGTWTPTAVGTYYWGVSFSGDTFNDTTSQCGGALGVANETVNVIKASPPMSTNDTSYDHSTLVAGTQYTNVGDSASLGAGFVPGGTGGTVTFTLYSEPTCTTAVSPQPTPNSGTNIVAIDSTAGTASFSATWTPTATGTYYWGVYFSGDELNNSTSQCGGAAGVTNETITVVGAGLIAPTNTTCSNFTGSIGSAEGSIYDLDQVHYAVSNGLITQSVNPGVFFYYTKITAPSAGNLTVSINQTENSSNPNLLFGVANAPATSQVQVYNSDCTSFSGTAPTITFSGANLSQTQLTFSGLSSGQTIIIGVKYNTKSIAGQPAPSPSTVHYTFSTEIGTTVVDTDPGGLDLVTP